MPTNYENIVSKTQKLKESKGITIKEALKELGFKGWQYNYGMKKRKGLGETKIRTRQRDRKPKTSSATTMQTIMLPATPPTSNDKMVMVFCSASEAVSILRELKK